MPEGYTDTPKIPGTDYHVHDPNRPQPRVVTPGNMCDLPPVTPPSDAEVLFDGSARLADNWVQVKDESPLKWRGENG